MREIEVSAGSSRRLHVLDHGPENGRPVFALHGTPGSHSVFGPWAADGAAHGLRLLSYDRPGYCRSTRHEGRSVGDTAREVAAIADELRLERFGVWGFSGGGAPAIACAALLPDRVVGAASLAGVAPYPSEGLDWVAGSGEMNAEDFRLMLRDRGAWEEKSKRDRQALLTATPEGLGRMYSSLLSEVDRAAITPEWSSFLVRQLREGLGSSDAGMVDDNLSSIRPWGFSLAEIRTPLQIWHGDQDRFVPFAHGEWLVRHIPKAEAHLHRGLGHTSVMMRAVPEVHRWLRERFG